MLQSSVALPLTQKCLAPPVCSFDEPELSPRSHRAYIRAAGDWRPWLICTLHAGFHGLPFHAGPCGLELIKWSENGRCYSILRDVHASTLDMETLG